MWCLGDECPFDREVPRAEYILLILKTMVVILPARDTYLISLAINRLATSHVVPDHP